MANIPLKDITMERVKVGNLENQKIKIVDESILFFSKFFLSKFSLEALYNTWV